MPFLVTAMVQSTEASPRMRINYLTNRYDASLEMQDLQKIYARVWEVSLEPADKLLIREFQFDESTDSDPESQS